MYAHKTQVTVTVTGYLLTTYNFYFLQLLLREHPSNKERSYGNFLVHFESCNDNLVGY